ncbi:MAG TPA: hypothetical protein VGH59_04235 [Casimicrobiaceae bacterium]
MMSSASESIVPATHRRWVRRLLYAAGTVALLVLAVWGRGSADCARAALR